ncbi:MAG: DUF5615 family PIN-like protein [Candidatus Babeliales bacterium]|jgi:predicted nuclease of predicted toxin-antitoxin system
MKFLVDECVGQGVAHWLCSQNHDALFVGSIMQGATDNDVLQKAYIDNRILITCDKDFGDMIFRTGKKHYGIVLIRIMHETLHYKVAALKLLIQQHSEQLLHNFTVVTDTAIRIIKLKH